MAKLRIRNTSNTNLGFSCGFLFKGQSLVINEERVSAADHRMISAKGLEVTKVDEVLPAPTPSMVKPEVFGKKKEEGPSDATSKTVAAPVNVQAAPLQEPVVTPDPAKPVQLDGPKPEAPVAPASAPAEPKVHTREQLEAMSKAQLKNLVQNAQVDKRNRGEMINKILELQGKG